MSTVTAAEMYSTCHQLQLPNTDLFMGRLARLVYLTSCLPGRDYSLSGFNFEKLVSEALGPGSHYSSSRSAVDVVRETPSGNTVGFQIKTSKTVRNVFVWSRIALEDKLERIPASHVSHNMAQEIGSELFSDFLDIVSGSGVEVDELYYLQAMREGNSMKVIVSDVCLDAVSHIYAEDVEWTWSEPLTGLYPVLEGRMDGDLMFSWCGMSGNHFKVHNMSKFLTLISSQEPSMYTLPLRVTPVGFDELEPILSGI